MIGEERPRAYVFWSNCQLVELQTEETGKKIEIELFVKRKLEDAWRRCPLCVAFGRACDA